jgi:hypothetical protein
VPTQRHGASSKIVRVSRQTRYSGAEREAVLDVFAELSKDKKEGTTVAEVIEALRNADPHCHSARRRAMDYKEMKKLFTYAVCQGTAAVYRVCQRVYTCACGIR